MKVRSTVGSGIAALLGLLLLLPQSAAAQDGVRVVPRDTRTSGDPSIAMEHLEPSFGAEPQMQEALRNVDRGRGGRSHATLAAWLERNGADRRAHGVRFALGRSHVDAERWSEASQVLAECIAEGGLFEDYCLYDAARAAFEQQRLEQAEALAATVREEAVLGPRSRYLRGRALAALTRCSDAAEVFEAFLSTWPQASYRRDVEFDLAATYRACERWDDAARIYHRIALLHPGDAAETRAERELAAIRDRLSSAVRTQVTNRSAAELVQRAQVLFDRHRSEQVISLLEGVASGTDGGEAWCQANYLIGKSYTKLRRHGPSIPSYEAVVGRCQDEDLIVKGLYNLGRAYWNVDRNQEAYNTYERLWRDFPSHSYADDAMLYGVRVLRNLGRTRDASALLARLLETYPTGDMYPDAVWMLLSEAYAAGDFRGANQFAEERGARTGETDLYTRGRIAYFRGRALEQLSLVTEAKAVYESVVRTHPMSYYALLSLNRMGRLNAPQRDALLEELRQSSERTEDRIRIRPPEVREDPFFRRGMEMLQLGLFGMAEAEFGKLSSRFRNDPEVGWLLAALYDRAGAYHLSHHVPGDRQGLNLWYPAGENVERWQIAYPRPWWDEVSRFAQERNLDPWMVYAIMREESGFRPEVESWANARGLLQLMLPTAEDMARLTGRGSVTAQQLFDPAINIELGTMFMRRLGDLFDNHPALIIGGYNGGQGNIRNWLRARGSMPLDLWVEEIPFAQTRNYVKRVTMTYWVYRWLYGEGDAMVELSFDLSSL
jgi:soluble lytic murein transglycosylase